MYLVDYHIHTKYSFDAVEDPESVCQQALHKGLCEIAFTEHMDVHPGGKTGEQYYFQHERERAERMAQLKARYEGKLVIRYGLELGQPHRDADFARAFLQNRAFDVVLGSVHYTTDDRELLHIPYRDFQEADEAVRDYFDHVYQMLDFPGFDVVAHICHPLRVMEPFLKQPSFMRYYERIEPILKKSAQQGRALEISAKGLRLWIGALEPEMEVLKAFRKLGGEYLTIGTDSHDEYSVGYGVDLACQYARAAGFHYYTTYEARRPVQHRLP